MSTPLKDYTVYCGRKYNLLMVLGVKPREKDAKGKMKPARFIVKCTACGRVYDADANAVIAGRQKGCTCMRGRRDYPLELGEYFKDKPEEWSQVNDRQANVIERLKPKWECTHNYKSGCVLNELCSICCWECDKPCKMCENRPEKCGAKSRAKKKKKKGT